MIVVFVLLIFATAFSLADAFRVSSTVGWTPLAWACVFAAAAVWIYESTEVLR